LVGKTIPIVTSIFDTWTPCSVQDVFPDSSPRQEEHTVTCQPDASLSSELKRYSGYLTTPSDPELPFHQSEPHSPLALSFADPLPSPWSVVPAAPVVYNPKIKQKLNFSVVKTFNFTTGVAGVKFSPDGNYFAVAIDLDETHIYDVVTMSKT
jgi:hypothetical protein